MTTESAQRHILSGSSFEREIAAFLVDATSHGSSDDDDDDTFGRCGVPITTRAELSHPAFHSNGELLKPKMGSLQAFVPHDFVACDLAPQLFSPESVHRLAILDIR